MHKLYESLQNKFNSQNHISEHCTLDGALQVTSLPPGDKIPTPHSLN